MMEIEPIYCQVIIDIYMSALYIPYGSDKTERKSLFYSR